MRLVVQKVLSSSVKVDGEIVGEIAEGYNILVGVTGLDNECDADYLAEKVMGLRIFKDENGKTNLSIMDVQSMRGNMGILAISQFTLCGDVRHGKRPAFTDAAPAEKAKALYDYFVSRLKAASEPIGIKIAEGIFQTHMEVSIVNDGPFTILLDSKKLF